MYSSPNQSLVAICALSQSSVWEHREKIPLMATNVNDYAVFSLYVGCIIILYYHQVELCSVQCVDQTKGLADILRLYWDNYGSIQS